VLAGAGEDFVVGGGLVLVVVGIDVVAAHGVVDEVVPHEEAAEVGVPVEDDAEEVEDLALLEFGAAPDGSEGGEMDGLVAVCVRRRRMTGPVRSSTEKRW
jgi:hypothetical protein